MARCRIQASVSRAREAQPLVCGVNPLQHGERHAGAWCARREAADRSERGNTPGLGNGCRRGVLSVDGAGGETWGSVEAEANERGEC